MDNAYLKLYKNSNELIVINHYLHHVNIMTDDQGILNPFDFPAYLNAFLKMDIHQ